MQVITKYDRVSLISAHHETSPKPQVEFQYVISILKGCKLHGSAGSGEGPVDESTQLGVCYRFRPAKKIRKLGVRVCVCVQWQWDVLNEILDGAKFLPS